MIDLFQGARKFRERVFPDCAERFREMSLHQNPHTLFITCSDSRIDPNLITSSEPGELFVIRNIANIVPVYTSVGAVSESAAAIEYAVKVLQVKRIVVCGHVNCGGCNAMFSNAEDVPALTRQWLIENGNTGAEVDALSTSELEQANVLIQLERLRSYPVIARQEALGMIELLGWYYDLAEGIIFDYNPGRKQFLPL